MFLAWSFVSPGNGGRALVDFNPLPNIDSKALKRPFSKEKVLVASSSLSRNKAPNPDGFSIAFWQFYWNVVKREVMGVFCRIPWVWDLLGKFKCHFYCPGSKEKGGKDLKDFWPISLVGSLYKLQAKVLANWLKKVVGNLVSYFQHAFVAGRQILDVVLIEN